MGKKWVYFCITHSLSFSSYSSWESHGELTSQQLHLEMGLVKMSAATSQLLFQRSFNVTYTINYCQRKQLPFLNIFLVNTHSHTLIENGPVEIGTLFYSGSSQIHELGVFFEMKQNHLLHQRALGKDPTACTGAKSTHGLQFDLFWVLLSD